MSYRRVILKRLKHFYDEIGAAEGSYLSLDPIDIVGRVVGEVRAAYFLHSSRIGDVRKELHGWRNADIVWISGVSRSVDFSGPYLVFSYDGDRSDLDPISTKLSYVC